MELITVSIADAAKALSVGRTTTYELINSGKLHAIKLGRRTLITVDSLKAVIGTAEVVGDLNWESASCRVRRTPAAPRTLTRVADGLAQVPPTIPR